MPVLFMNKLSVSLILATAVLLDWRAAAATQPASTNAVEPGKSAAKPAELFPDVAIVKGKGFEIKRSKLDDAVTSIKSTAMARGQNIPHEQMVMMEQQVLERELKFNITDEDVKKFYDESPAKFEQPAMVRASHILLATKDQTSGAELSDAQKTAKHKQMEGILKRARDGEDFAKLAKEFSEDAASKDKGGEYTFPRGQMVAEFEAASFSLKTNQVSDIITTQFGYHIIKLSEKLPAKKMEMAKVSQDIKDYLKGQAVQKQLPEYMEKAKKDADVQILDEKLKPVASALEALPAGKTDEKKPADVKKP